MLKDEPQKQNETIMIFNFGSSSVVLQLWAIHSDEFFSAGGTFPRFAGKAKTSGLIVPEKLDLRFSEKRG